MHIHPNHVIEQLSEDTLPDHLADCYRILMAGGLLTIRCPNALRVSYGFFFGFLHWIYGDVGNPENQHLSILTPTKLKHLIIEAGFEIVQISDPEWSNIIIVAKKTGRKIW
jgi:predicted SAM-dependent methyltransferase